MNLKPIWLVEDSANDIEFTLAAFEEGHLANKVVVLRDGSEALARLAELRDPSSMPAVVLLDIKMPKVSGVEVLRKIKGDPNLKSLPVVMLTSSREGPDITECYELGANGYVVKPVEFGDFFDALKTLGKFWAVLNERPNAAKGGEAANADVATTRA
jgi:CheY-like chemotaxis protein